LTDIAVDVGPSETILDESVTNLAKFEGENSRAGRLA
jgi:hypothetical protein